MITRIRVHWTILRISIEERLIYRADFALGTLLRFMPIVTTILLWQAIFNGVSPTSDSSKVIVSVTWCPITCLLCLEEPFQVCLV